jgi:hypothetical protein
MSFNQHAGMSKQLKFSSSGEVCLISDGSFSGQTIRTKNRMKAATLSGQTGHQSGQKRDISNESRKRPQSGLENEQARDQYDQGGHAPCLVTKWRGRPGPLPLFGENMSGRPDNSGIMYLMN